MTKHCTSLTEKGFSLIDIISVKDLVDKVSQSFFITSDISNHNPIALILKANKQKRKELPRKKCELTPENYTRTYTCYK